MGRVEVTRDEVSAIVKDAKSKSKNREAHFRAEIIKSHPELADLTITRNGNRYNAIDYLVDDLDSYAEV